MRFVLWSCGGLCVTRRIFCPAACLEPGCNLRFRARNVLPAVLSPLTKTAAAGGSRSVCSILANQDAASVSHVASGDRCPCALYPSLYLWKSVSQTSDITRGCGAHAVPFLAAVNRVITQSNVAALIRRCRISNNQ